MGAAPSVPTEAITEIASKTMKVFTPFYIKGYAGALVKQLKREAAPVPNPFHLMNITPPSEPIKMGLLTKQGAVRKSWKLRYFVARNAANNYVIEYFTDEAAFKANPQKPKGRIHMCNMKVKKVKDEEEVAKYGKFCFKVKPTGRRRTWFVRCEDEGSLKEWKAVFKYAAKKADAPLNEDECMRAAFEQAYEQTRWELDVWSWYRYDCTEEEMLGQLVVDKCEWECMGEVYAKIPSGPLYWKLRGMAEKALDSTVGAVVGAGWKAVSGGISSQKDTLKATAKSALGDIIPKQVELQASIKGGLMGAITPALTPVGTTIRPVIEAMSKPIYKAYRVAIKIFMTEMHKVVTSEHIHKSAEHFMGEIRWYWGIMWPAFERVRCLTRPGSGDAAKVKKMGIKISIADVLATFGEVSLWRIEDMFEDNIRTQMNKAIFTTIHEIDADTDKTTPREVIVKRTAQKLIHDAKIQAKQDINFILFQMIYQYVFKLVNPAMSAVLDPIAALIPGPLEPLMDVKDMAREVLESVVRESIDAVMEPGFSNELNKLDKLHVKLAL